jgi:major membrane immunogen (membrane-anchored lipoprotein)
MKKIKILLTFTVLAAVLAGFAGFQAHAIGNNAKNTQVRIQLARLMQEHQTFLQTAYGNTGVVKKNASYGHFEQNFFMNVSFLQDGQIQSFLRNVEHDIERSGSTGYTMMSYTSYIITNGQTHSVQYQYQSNGKDITLVKQTNNNGKLLRSVYFYDLDSGSLKADDFMENQKIHEKVYKI